MAADEQEGAAGRGGDGGGGGGGWDMRVYYEVPEAGDDARSRIGSGTCVQFGGSFANWGRQGVVQCWTGRPGMRALPRVWRAQEVLPTCVCMHYLSMDRRGGLPWPCDEMERGREREREKERKKEKATLSTTCTG